MVSYSFYNSYIYRLDTKADQQKYGEIIFDFSYLQVSDALDKKIEDNPVSKQYEVVSHILTGFLRCSKGITRPR